MLSFQDISRTAYLKKAPFLFAVWEINSLKLNSIKVKWEEDTFLKAKELKIIVMKKIHIQGTWDQINNFA